MPHAVVTLLYDPSYLPGALVLGVALLKLISLLAMDIEMAVLIDEHKFSDYQKQLLLQLYDTLIPVDTLTSTLRNKLEHDLGRPELASTFTKVALWGLTRYDKILYLDADTLPEYDLEHSVLDLLKLSFPHNKILAVPDSGFPDIFNSGVFVLQPNSYDYENLTNLVVKLHTDSDVSFDGADQGLLNQYFNPQPNWVTDLLEHRIPTTTEVGDAPHLQSSRWIKLPFLYNVTPLAQYQYLPAFNYFSRNPANTSKLGSSLFPPQPHVNDSKSYTDSTLNTINSYRNAALNYFRGGSQIKLVHFIGPVKPWHTEDEEIHSGHIHRKWWDLWSEYYGLTLSLETVAFWEKAVGDKIRDLKLQSRPELKEVEIPLEIEAVENESHDSDPLALCDPETYKDIPDSAPLNPDSKWDATKEPPPQHDEREQPTQEFPTDFGHFENTWDEGKTLPRQTAEEIIAAIEEEEEEVESDLDTIEEEVEEEGIAASELESEIGYERLFPWEFRARQVPERSWD